MKIIFDDASYQSDYADNRASTPGRMEAIMSVLGKGYWFEIVRPQPASDEELLLANPQSYVDKIKTSDALCDMVKLAAGAAIAAAEIAMSGEPAFGCLRPPGQLGLNCFLKKIMTSLS